MINKILISIGIVMCIYLLLRNYNKRVEHFYGFLSWFKTDDFWNLLCVQNPFPLSFNMGSIIEKLFGGITKMFKKLKKAVSGAFLTDMIKYIKNIGTAITNATSSFIIKMQLRVVDMPSKIKSKLLNVAEKGFRGVRGIYDKNIGKIKSVFTSVIGQSEKIVPTITKSVKKMGSMMETLVSTVLNFLKNVLKKLHGLIKGILSLLLKAVSAFKGFISKIGSMISSVLKLLNPKKILTTISSMVLKILNLFKSLFTMIINIFTGKYNAIKYIKNLIKKFEKLIKQVAGSFT